MLRSTAFSLCLLLALAFGLSAAQAQPTADASSGLTPGPWEVTAQVSTLSYWQSSAAGRSSRGFGLRAGWRPTASRRGLVEVYALHVPRGEAASGAPRFGAFGVAGTFLAREADKRINPYVSVGLGLWRVDARPPVPCPGPQAPDSRCLTADHSFEDATLPAATFGAGLYLTALPFVALRIGGKIHGPLGEGGDSGSPRPVFSAGLSIRP